MKTVVLNLGNKAIKNVVQDFVYGCWCSGRRIGGMQMPPLNLLYVATTLLESGVDVEFIDSVVNYSLIEKVKKEIKGIQAVIALSSTNSFQSDLKILREFKRLNKKLVIVLFGSHPTFMPEYCLEEGIVDISIYREPEHIIRDLVKLIIDKKDWSGLKGIIYKKDGQIRKNDPYPFIDLDELPIPDRTLLIKGVDYYNPVVKRVPYTTIQTSRGCPAKCNFCTVPAFYGEKVRFRSVDNVMKEIGQLITCGYKELFFRDETFTAHKQRNIEICHRIINEKSGITWIANGRVDMIDEEQLSIMKRAGCHLIKFGVESGNQKILDGLNKGIDLRQTRTAFKLCKKLGIDAHAHVMLGAPGESMQTALETIQFVKDIDPATASFGIFTPYPGTAIFAEVAGRNPGMKDGSNAVLEKLHTSVYYNEFFTELSKEELEKLVRKAYRSFYLRPAYLLKRMCKIDSFSELVRLIVAGSNIFAFTMGGENQ